MKLSVPKDESVAKTPPHPDIYQDSDKLLITGDDVLIEYVQ